MNSYQFICTSVVASAVLLCQSAVDTTDYPSSHNLADDQVLLFANGTKVTTSRQDGKIERLEKQLGLGADGWTRITSWCDTMTPPLGGLPFLQLFWGLTTTLRGGRNINVLSVDLQLPRADFTRWEILEKLGPGNGYRFDFWLAAQPEALPKVFFDESGCSSSTHGCSVCNFYNHTFDWFNSAMIVHAYRGGADTISHPYASAPSSGFVDDPSMLWGDEAGPEWIIVPNVEFAQQVTYGKRIYAKGGDVLQSEIRPVHKSFWSIRAKIGRTSSMSSNLPHANVSELIADTQAMAKILEALTQKGAPTKPLFASDDATILGAKGNTWRWSLAPYQRWVISSRPKSVEALPMMFPNVTIWRNLRIITNQGDVLRCNSSVFDPLFELPDGMQLDLRDRLTVNYNHVLGLASETDPDHKFLKCINAILQLFNRSVNFGCDDIANDGSFAATFILFPDGKYPEECFDPSSSSPAYHYI